MRVAFTIAFGDGKYRKMSEVLKKTVERYSPDTDFRIIDEFTPYDEGLPDRELFPKDYKYPKLEILSKMDDPDTEYLFIDADAFVFCNLGLMFDNIEPGKLIIEWGKSKDGLWSGRKNYKFVENMAEAGVEGLKPYQINSGFMMWKGEMPCFKKSLEYIKNYTALDPKGKRGDEYYLCAAIQKTDTVVKPLNKIKNNQLGTYWNGKIGYNNGMLTNSRYKTPRYIQHYGNKNWDNEFVQKVVKKYG